MNFFSDLIGSLFHQDHRDAHTEFSRHRDNGHPRSQMARMGPANRAEKFPELPVLADRRPGGLDELASKPPISSMGDRPSIGSLSRRVLGRHQAQKPSQLANVFKLSPIPDAGHKLTGHNPADPGNRHQISNALGQFGIVSAEAADLSSRLKNLLLRKLQTVEQLIELKAHGLRTLKLSQFVLDHERPLSAGGSRGKLDPFEEQQRFDALLHPHHLAHKRIAQLSQVAQLAVQSGGNMDALQLSPTQDSPTVLDCRAGWSSLFVLALWGSSMERRSSRDRPSPPTHHTIRTPSVQPRRQRPPSDRQSACAHDSQDAPRYSGMRKDRINP